MNKILLLLAFLTGSIVATAQTVATPAISPTGATYNNNQILTITESTPGANICYTKNGTTPTASLGVCTNGYQYVGPIPVTQSMTVQAIGSLSGYSNSAISSQSYIMVVATPSFITTPGSYTGVTPVYITTTTAAANCYYTLDGSTPTTLSTEYSGSITLSSSPTVKVICALTGYSNSGVITGSYTLTVNTPTFSLAAGSYITNQYTTIREAVPGATCYYTTDGSTPTTSSAVYSTQLTISSTQIIKSFCSYGTMTNSAIASSSYTILPIPNQFILRGKGQFSGKVSLP